MKMKLIGSAVAAVLFASFSVQADDKKYFSGGYIGAEGGYIDLSGGGSGIYYGGIGGVRTQLDNGLVLGIEGTYGGADVQYLDHVWSISGSIGMVVGEQKKGLLYVGGGYAEAKASGFGLSATGDDYMVKAGYEHALGKTFSLRGQAASYAFDDVSATLALMVRF